MRKLRFIAMVAALGVIFGSAILQNLQADNFVGKEKEISVSFVEASVYELKKSDFIVGMLDENIALYAASADLTYFLNGRQTGQKISIVKTKNGFYMNRSDSRSAQSVVHQGTSTRLYSDIAPKTYALRQDVPYIFTLAGGAPYDTSSDIEQQRASMERFLDGCNIVRANVFSKSAKRADIVIDMSRQRSAAANSEVVFFLECENSNAQDAWL